ncbi:MAG: hypothetical protein Q8O88_01910 [bacterium]|nr:hypothetical protein [bacterium]
MIEIIYSKNFLKSVKKLPANQQEKLADLLILMQKNPYHYTLHTKRLGVPLIGFLSFRITRDWRVLFQFINATTIQLSHIAHRKDIYR